MGLTHSFWLSQYLDNYSLSEIPTARDNLGEGRGREGSEPGLTPLAAESPNSGGSGYREQSRKPALSGNGGREKGVCTPHGYHVVPPRSQECLGD